jgi:uncharacterized HhH-GPD family protein
MTTGTLPITGEPEADRLLVENPFALLLGMLLDQQVPMEWAFRGPHTLEQRLGAPLDAEVLAALGEDKVEELFRAKPALHRYPGSMGKRAYALAAHVVEHYGGDTAAIWRDAATGEELFRRLHDLPGYGDEKAKIFLAILGKRLGITPAGWEDAAAPFSDATPRSVADVDSPEALARVRAFKKAQKALKKGKAE